MFYSLCKLTGSLDSIAQGSPEMPSAETSLPLLPITTISGTGRMAAIRAEMDTPKSPFHSKAQFPTSAKGRLTVLLSLRRTEASFGRKLKILKADLCIAHPCKQSNARLVFESPVFCLILCPLFYFTLLFFTLFSLAFLLRFTFTILIFTCLQQSLPIVVIPKSTQKTRS